MSRLGVAGATLNRRHTSTQPLLSNPCSDDGRRGIDICRPTPRTEDRRTEGHRCVRPTEGVLCCLPDLKLKGDGVDGGGGGGGGKLLEGEELAGRLEVGSVFTFRVTVLQASAILPEYADIFCQFK